MEPMPPGNNSINPYLFRGYSIRGIAAQDLTDDVVVAIGQAIGTFFARRGAETLVVGRDVRTSSPRINHSLNHGISTTNISVIDVGIVPTPVHNFATDMYAADGGVMVTASHNPAEYNGLKIRSDRTLGEEDLREIYEIAVQCPAAETPATLAEETDVGVRQADPLPSYLERVTAHADMSSRLRVVVDGGNGAAGPIVSRLLRDLGVQVVEIHCQPDGRFPDRDPDPTAPGATDALAAAVRDETADCGLAFDGDGDRLLLVDEQGNLVLGDQVLMLLARDVLSAGPARIVHEVLCTQALADDVIAHGGQPIMTPTGYAFVHPAMLDTGAALGGELSGHLFLNQPGFRFDDAILGTVIILSIMSRNSHPLSGLVAELPAYHSSPPIRLACPDEIKGQVVERVREHFENAWRVDDLDGARIDFGDGWALVRASNTQPALSLRFEASSEQRLSQLTDQVMQQVEHWMNKLSEANAQKPSEI